MRTLQLTLKLIDELKLEFDLHAKHKPPVDISLADSRRYVVRWNCLKRSIKQLEELELLLTGIKIERDIKRGKILACPKISK